MPQHPDLPGVVVEYEVDERGDKWIRSDDLFALLSMNRFDVEVAGISDHDDPELQTAIRTVCGYIDTLVTSIRTVIDDDESADIADDLSHGQQAV